MAAGRGRRKQRTRWTAQEAEAVLARWRASGRSLRSFCEREGIDRQRVQRWKTKLGDPGPTVSQVQLHEVAIVPDDSASHGSETLTLERPDGWRIHAGPGFDEAALDRLLAVLERRA